MIDSITIVFCRQCGCFYSVDLDNPKDYAKACSHGGSLWEKAPFIKRLSSVPSMTN